MVKDTQASEVHERIGLARLAKCKRLQDVATLYCRTRCVTALELLHEPDETWRALARAADEPHTPSFESRVVIVAVVADRLDRDRTAAALGAVSAHP